MAFSELPEKSDVSHYQNQRPIFAHRRFSISLEVQSPHPLCNTLEHFHLLGCTFYIPRESKAKSAVSQHLESEMKI